ncbi:MAG: acyl carrier protein [bacterium]|nr:acyl carrier protein [bacterium]
MTKNEISSKISDLISKEIDKSYDLKDIDINQDFQSLGINSIHVIKIIVILEDEFDIEINDDYLNIDNLSNIKTLVDYIYREIGS